MSRLRRALNHAVTTLVVVGLATLAVTPAQAAPSAPPPRDDPSAPVALHPHSVPTDSIEQAAVEAPPWPFRAGITADGLGIWLKADTDTPGSWRIDMYNDEGLQVCCMDLVQPRTRQEYPMFLGGWYHIYVVNTVTKKEVYLDSFDIQGALERVSGISRFETSAAISENSFKRGVPVAYVANGLNFPDALSGAAAAGVLGGPVLLTRPDVLPAAIKNELKRLVPAKIVVLGGTGAVSNAVVQALDPYTTGPVQRIGGATRFETSALISSKAFSPGVPVAYVANGLNFPDALSGAAAAGTKGGPVLLTMPTTVPAAILAELDRLNPQQIIVLGGKDVVSPAVATKLAAYTTGSVKRLAGISRFETSAAISTFTFKPGVPVAYIANAYNFPDALSGAAAAGMFGGPVLLARPGYLEQAVINELDRLNPKRIVVLGGSDAISQQLLGMEANNYVEQPVQRTGGDYIDDISPAPGPQISNLSITSNNLSVTVSFDYVHPANWFTPVYVGIYPGPPSGFPYGDLDSLGDYGLNDDWAAWMYMPDGKVSGHASQSFPLYDHTGPLTVMLFGSKLCECAGGTEFIVGREFAAVP